MIYDLIIIGGGPAGVAAGIYAARKWLKTILITDEFGGQSAVSEDIQNWIGTISIHGKKLAKNLKKHLLAYAEDVVDVVENEKVEEDDNKNVIDRKGNDNNLNDSNNLENKRSYCHIHTN